MQRLAVLGGTFNPIHCGHLLMAEAALHQQQLDQVIWLPTHHPPHKSSAKLVDFSHRLAMVKQAIDPYPAFTVSEIERHQTGATYTIDTFTQLQALYPGDRQWYWILGLDAFQTLPHWYRHRELIPRSRWLVAPRSTPAQPNLQPTDASALCKQVAEKLRAESIDLHWQLLDQPPIAVSSGLVRQYCRDRRSIRHLVPDAVRLYIEAHQLYEVGGGE